MADFLTAVGLVLIFEGLFYGGFPQFAKRMLAQVLELDDNALRWVGAISVIAGLFLVWMMRG